MVDDFVFGLDLTCFWADSEYSLPYSPIMGTLENQIIQR